MALLFLALIIVKLTCVRKLGLLIGLVTVSATFETIALFYIIGHSYISKEEHEGMSKEEQLSLQIIPVCILAISLIFNLSVSCSY